MNVGEFEAHVTVRCDDGDAQVGRLERWAAARGWKFTHIVLARGRMPSQPMVTLYGCGHRASDPEFAGPGSRAAWRAARRTAMDLVLAAVAGSPWREHLVLRGSVLLAQWYGEAAREPGDLDFVVVPGRGHAGRGRARRVRVGRRRPGRRRAGGVRGGSPRQRATAPAQRPPAQHSSSWSSGYCSTCASAHPSIAGSPPRSTPTKPPPTPAPCSAAGTASSSPVPSSRAWPSSP